MERAASLSEGLSPSWETQWRESLRSVEDLVREGLVDAGAAERLRPVLARYRFLLPRYYASLIDRADPRCPIRLQAVPDPDELAALPGDGPDPLADLVHQPAPRVTHRYRGRALLQLTPNCSMYCRFCFRKSLLNELKDDLFDGELETALDYFAARPDVEEVILSGGDPLLVSTRAMGALVTRLSRVAHLKRLRVHTRVPVTLPARITESLVTELTSTRLPVVMVMHFNHPRELTEATAEAASRLRKGGVTLLNQTVLLKGVNDEADTLVSLSEGLFDQGILPYYLHHPDAAAGTSRFRLSERYGREIHEGVRRRLPGYLVPRYVKDVVGAPYKATIF